MVVGGGDSERWRERQRRCESDAGSVLERNESIYMSLVAERC